MKLPLQPGVRRPLLGLLAAAGLSLAWLSAAPAQAAALGSNLIVNGDAEADAGATSDSQVAPPPGWRTTGEFTAVQYGAPGGFPNAKSPGPGERGKNFFAGGNQSRSTASQTIDLSAHAAAIAAGRLTYTLSGWLGGLENQRDAVRVEVTFKDASGWAVGTPVVLGPVTPAQRKFVTGLVYRAATGVVPSLARSAAVSVVITRLAGAYNDGLVDDLSLVLK